MLFILLNLFITKISAKSKIMILHAGFSFIKDARFVYEWCVLWCTALVQYLIVIYGLKDGFVLVHLQLHFEINHPCLDIILILKTTPKDLCLGLFLYSQVEHCAHGHSWSQIHKLWPFSRCGAVWVPLGILRDILRGTSSCKHGVGLYSTARSNWHRSFC